MKKKYLFLLPALTCAFQTSALAQTHPDLAGVASKIDTSAEYIKLNKVSGDLAAITQYLELILDTARKSGEEIPPNLKAKDMMEILGVNTLKAFGNSSNKVDNAWLNLSYMDNGGSKKGIFSLFGEKDQAYVVPNISPAGTDIALQLQLDLRQVEEMVSSMAKAVGEGDKIDENMKKPIPELGMTASEVLGKMNVRVNFMMDLDAADKLPEPFGVGRPYMAARIDGVAWLWEKLGKRALAESEAPIDMSQKDGLIILKPNLEARTEMTEGQGAEISKIMKLSPIVIIDTAKNHIWIATNEDFLSKCMGSDNKLADSAEFKAAMEGLPGTANSMAYVSKELLKNVAEKYKMFAGNGMLLDEDFEKAKPLVDRLLEDITESDKGWAMTVTVDDNGILTASRGPLATKHLEYLSGLAPALGAMIQEKSAENMRARDMRREIEE